MADDPRGPWDVVGDRVLVGIQMVDISRLSAHPVPMTSEGLITVAGQGPKDSNGAGKSSFIAALSLLHADDQWRLASGAASAAELLFTAELAAQEARWSNADRGYVIGVFAAPGAGDPEELAASALTVWLRINRRAPYLDLRWTAGLHVPCGASDDERARRVDALWDELPRSNGRTDFHANRLAGVLYGGQVRCVSFLSTSVRASQTANLLAQPLNELSPERIFDAIATLTGLDRELEQEQALRGTEHGHRSAVAEAEADLAAWEREITVVEAGIAHRARSRELLGTARTAWHGRCARYLVDGAGQAVRIRGELAALDADEAELRQRLEAARDDLATLRDDTAFAARFRERERAYQELAGRDRELERAQDKAAQGIEDRTARLRRLREQAAGTDGRDPEQAVDEERRALRSWRAAVEAKGAAEALRARAAAGLAAAESGDDVAAGQLRRLREAGIPAVALLDVVGPDGAGLDDAERDRWEPRLLPYRSAVVVYPADADRGYHALHDLPGSMLVEADEPDRAGPEPRFTVDGFLAALADRAGDDAASPSGPTSAGPASGTGPASGGRVDVAAGVRIVGGFPEPITGRAARIATARQELALAVAGIEAAEEAVATADRLLARARGRTAATRAAIELAAVESEVDRLRAENAEREKLREVLQPELDVAYRDHQAVQVERSTRDQRMEALAGQVRRLTNDVLAREQRRDALVEERDRLDLTARRAAWDGTPEEAERYLLSLPEPEQARTLGEWNEEACHQLGEVVRLAFPEETPAEQLPAEIRELLVEQRWRRGGLEVRVRLVPALLRALHAHLTNTERQDRYDERQIAEQRAQRSKDLAAARAGLAEATRASEVHRSSLATGIKAKLRQVADEFDRIDRDYGGYGAGLDCPEPEPPSQPDKPWRWAVTPKWRRAENQRHAPYRLRANTAQLDEKAVKLVCAAALAGTGSRPLLLVLDELGRNLGSEHRREAVALFERIGADRNITVVGALQDDMERYAINASGLYVKLRRSSDASPYNEAPVVMGSEPNRARVALLHDWLAGYRPQLHDPLQ